MNEEALNAAIEAVRSRDIATLDLAIKVGIEVYLAALAKPASSPAGGDVVTVAMIDAAMVEMKNLHPPMRRSECERLLRAALRAADAS